MFTEQLPATDAKKPQKKFVNWHTLAGFGLSHGGRPVLGVMELLTVMSAKRTLACRYVVSEVATGWDGRAFHLRKADGDDGSDEDCRELDVFVARNAQDHRCECKGYLRHSRCKHLDSLKVLLAHDQLGDVMESPVNPEADTSNTEVVEFWDAAGCF